MKKPARSAAGASALAIAALCFAFAGAARAESIRLSAGRPHVVDFGAGGRCGVAVFDVVSHSGEPVLRIAYANHPSGLGPGGCFTRETSATYLGRDVELPVLPSNPGRHELYRICRNGRYVAPLLQGQARYAKLTLDAPGEVEISGFRLENAGSFREEEMQGSFECSDGRYTRLWRIGAWTAQIASVPDHGAWRVAGGRLLPRKLAFADGSGWCKTPAPCDGELLVEYEFDANPHHAACSFDLLAGDRRTAVKQTSTNAFAQAKAPIRKGERFGLSAPKESWPVVSRIALVDASGAVRLEYRFDAPGALDAWSFAKAFPFLADGAKRDRLVWSGDLWWAERNVFYSFDPAADPFMKGSLELLEMSQTPSGYVQACPYAEISKHPADGEYGPFPSDEFSAWFIPVLADWWLYSGDRDGMLKLYPAAAKAMAYLETHTAPDGTFAQRRETSKHACNLQLGDVSHRCYMDLLLWKCRIDFATLAEAAGDAAAAAAQRAKAEKLAAAIRKLFWNPEAKCFLRSATDRNFGFEASALALAVRFLEPDEAAAVAKRFVRHSHGKFQLLAARGMMEYGLTDRALAAIEKHNWMKLLSPSWKGALSTTECMSMYQRGWGDESHPDTAPAGILSTYILGVEPVAPGYARWSFKPQPCAKISSASGKVPVPGGRFIDASWKLEGGTFSAELRVPRGTEAELALPAGFKALASKDGSAAQSAARILGPGAWKITATREAAK